MTVTVTTKEELRNALTSREPLILISEPKLAKHVKNLMTSKRPTRAALISIAVIAGLSIIGIIILFLTGAMTVIIGGVCGVFGEILGFLGLGAAAAEGAAAAGAAGVAAGEVAAGGVAAGEVAAGGVAVAEGVVAAAEVVGAAAAEGATAAEGVAAVKLAEGVAAVPKGPFLARGFLKGFRLLGVALILPEYELISPGLEFKQGVKIRLKPKSSES